MPVSALYAKPSDDHVGLGTTVVSMTNEDTAYPATNMANNNPGDVAKATTTSTVITINGVANVTIEGFVIINHNLAGATVTLANPLATPKRLRFPPAHQAMRLEMHGAIVEETRTRLTMTGP